MAEESPGVIPPRTQERYEALADAQLDCLLERVKNKTATASDLKEARELLEKAGVRFVVKAETKAGELARNLPNLPPVEDEVVVLDNGITVRQVR
jgi:hypothetical protein